MGRLLPWILSLLALIAIVWIVGTSQVFQDCIEKRQTGAGSENFYSDFPQLIIAYRVCLGGFVRNSANSIIAVFTVILAVSTIFLWAVTRDLARNSERALIIGGMLIVVAFGAGCLSLDALIGRRRS